MTPVWSGGAATPAGAWQVRGWVQFPDDPDAQHALWRLIGAPDGRHTGGERATRIERFPDGEAWEDRTGAQVAAFLTT